ncbi:aromatic ring-hydroxylating oxygenase subunit alpha [Ilumatobacter coccineus]|uniref:Putative iron-sulfur protein n=1 Tax=Ilumatobacter coccineus (strain NBRC 103263 / KCTC 29153 / YM16-304) TaxID=1313172 RepID=A0A6C7E9N5_ILUCY|nr:aromatic ring-hydroxylating dioxygenase subunit alpha [Ilumatobacter coccineus]BAN02732.1 putative iron-sulfur protein [Ilumatobacter coccineus YM16-304]
MDNESARTQLIAQLRRTIEHIDAGTIPLVDDTMSIPVDRYQNQERWEEEIEKVFKTVPLMMGFSSELKEAGAYKAMDVCGMKFILTRGSDGELRGFVNMCSHRGAQLVEEGSGASRRFTCPYHAWNYDHDGALVGVTNRQDFGEVDTSCLGLTSLPVAEKCGLMWVVLDPNGSIDIDAHLGGYATMLDHFDFGSWNVVHQQEVPGPNWKLAYDGYLDFYHLPFLHRDTFGPDYPSRPIYDAWGPHQRMTAPYEALAKWADVPDDEVVLSEIDGGVWTIFPHVSIAGFPVGERGLMVSQLFPGDTPDTSKTIQNFIVTDEPTDELIALAAKHAEFFDHVVRNEDYYTGIRIGKNIASGAKSEFVFGRNEGGGQFFHTYLDSLLDT